MFYIRNTVESPRNAIGCGKQRHALSIRPLGDIGGGQMDIDRHVRLDAFVLPMPDGSNGQVRFQLLERLLHLGELQVELP